MVISEVPHDLAKKVRLLAAEHDRSRTEVLVIALRIVFDDRDLYARLTKLLTGTGTR